VQEPFPNLSQIAGLDMLRKTIGRRRFIHYCLGASAAAIGGLPAVAQEIAPHPDAAKFKNGDFLWPARPGAFIPFNNTRSLRPDMGAADWEDEKRRFIEEARQSGNPEQIAIADQIEPLSFEEFRALFFDDGPPAPTTRGLSPFGGRLPEVGHIAIIEIDKSGKPWVVEAMPKAQYRYESLYSRFQNGVVRSTYANWIEQHNDYNVWHGRLGDASQAKRDKIVPAAKDFLGRDYWFWSFNLADYSGFYCSKLVWVSVWNSLGISLDGDQTFGRKFWVTPKALINSKLVEMIHSPGTYGR
jgi:hypothetical protein